MHQPTPRIDLGIALRGIANSALDISDGLLGDLRHILKQSNKDAEIYLERIPKSATLHKQSRTIQNQYAANGGDDYELCFTAASSTRDAITKISGDLNLSLTQIGSVKSMQHSAPEIHIIDNDGKELNSQQAGLLLKSFDHFA
jgi:thiamine-monophosphate kinase